MIGETNLEIPPAVLLVQGQQGSGFHVCGFSSVIISGQLEAGKMAKFKVKT